MIRLEQVLASLRTPQESGAFLSALWSRREIADVTHRWQAIQLIHSGNSHRRVRDQLAISIATATRAARAIRDNPQIIDKVIRRFR